MIAKHLFIFQDAFNPDQQVTGGAKDLATKYGPGSYSVTMCSINGQSDKISAQDCIKKLTNEANAKNDFRNRVGVYLISHVNNPFSFAGAAGVAKMICDYLDSRDDLGIDHKMLDKLVLVTCGGAEGLKKKFHDKEAIKKMSSKVKANEQSQENFANNYKEASKLWNEERQKELDKRVAKYEDDTEKFFKEGGNTMVLLACALDKRGVYPKIAAWDSLLYVRDDGRKSTRADYRGRPGDPVQPHRRLLSKMMIQFTRTESGPGSIIQLQSQEWSDKAPSTQHLTTQPPKSEI